MNDILPPSSPRATGDNEYVQLQYAVKSLAQLGSKLLNCAKVKVDEVEATRATFLGLQRALEFQEFHLQSLLGALLTASQGAPSQRAQELSKKCVETLKKVAPMAYTILDAIPHGSDRSKALSVKDDFMRLAGEFKDTVIALTATVDSNEVAGVALFATGGLRLPQIVAKLGGKGVLGRYWQWRKCDAQGSSLVMWPPNDDDKKKQYSVIGATFSAITRASDPETFTKLAKTKCEAPQGIDPPRNAAFIMIKWTEKDKTHYLSVSSEDLERWIRLLNFCKKSAEPPSRLEPPRVFAPPTSPNRNPNSNANSGTLVSPREPLPPPPYEKTQRSESTATYNPLKDSASQPKRVKSGQKEIIPEYPTEDDIL